MSDPHWWRCQPCGAWNDRAARVCEVCGEPAGAKGATVPAPRPAWTPPPSARETDVCTEVGCTKTLAEHRAEARRLLRSAEGKAGGAA